MQLTNLFVLASVTLGAIAQYDDRLYNEAAYGGAFDYTNAEEVAVAYGAPGQEEEILTPNQCKVLRAGVGGQVHEIKVVKHGFCELFLEKLPVARTTGITANPVSL
ncbi:cell wall protein [Metarhizium anisopliae]|nr:cell wall protein [Metarhizium anisopliae]